MFALLPPLLEASTPAEAGEESTKRMLESHLANGLGSNEFNGLDFNVEYIWVG